MIHLHPIPEVASILSVSTKTIERLLKSGDLQAVDISPSGSKRRSLRITGESVEAFIAKRKAETAETNNGHNQGRNNGNGPAKRGRRSRLDAELEFYETLGSK